VSGKKARTRRTPNPVEKTQLALDFGKRYRAGGSIRSIAEETGWSYGFVQRVLADHGVKLRNCGPRPRQVERETGRVAS
jgi:hypothetical protein